jgi:hypothetical protein
MIFAAATPEAGFLLNLIVAVNVAAVFGLKKQKREINWAFEPASKREFDEHVRASKKDFDEHVRANEAAMEQITKEASARRQLIYSKIEQSEARVMQAIEALRKENKDDTACVHDRVNDVLKAVSELRGRILK